MPYIAWIAYSLLGISLAVPDVHQGLLGFCFALRLSEYFLHQENIFLAWQLSVSTNDWIGDSLKWIGPMNFYHYYIMLVVCKMRQ